MTYFSRIRGRTLPGFIPMAALIGLFAVLVPATALQAEEPRPAPGAKPDAPPPGASPGPKAPAAFPVPKGLEGDQGLPAKPQAGASRRPRFPQGKPTPPGSPSGPRGMRGGFGPPADANAESPRPRPSRGPQAWGRGGPRGPAGHDRPGDDARPPGPPRWADQGAWDDVGPRRGPSARPFGPPFGGPQALGRGGSRGPAGYDHPRDGARPPGPPRWADQGAWDDVGPRPGPYARPFGPAFGGPQALGRGGSRGPAGYDHPRDGARPPGPPRWADQGAWGDVGPRPGPYARPFGPPFGGPQALGRGGSRGPAGYDHPRDGARPPGPPRWADQGAWDDVGPRRGPSARPFGPAFGGPQALGRGGSRGPAGHFTPPGPPRWADQGAWDDVGPRPGPKAKPPRPEFRPSDF